MAGEHQNGIALRIQRGDPVSQGITGIGVSGRFHVPIEDFLRFVFVTRRRTGVKQLSEKNRGGVLNEQEEIIKSEIITRQSSARIAGFNIQ